MLTKLFEQEVPEIYEGIVTIESAAREPGGRSKIAVASRDSDVDPVGACVGMKGSRVQAVVQELRGERIDIVPWSPDPARYVCSALSPAQVSKVIIDDAAKSMDVIVPDDQLSLAIGRKGQNVRLAVQLTGWKIDIKSESKMRELAQWLSEAVVGGRGLRRPDAELLLQQGVTSLEDLANLGQSEMLTSDCRASTTPARRPSRYAPESSRSASARKKRRRRVWRPERAAEAAAEAAAAAAEAESPLLRIERRGGGATRPRSRRRRKAPAESTSWVSPGGQSLDSANADPTDANRTRDGKDQGIQTGRRARDRPCRDSSRRRRRRASSVRSAMVSIDEKTRRTSCARSSADRSRRRSSPSGASSKALAAPSFADAERWPSRSPHRRPSRSHRADDVGAACAVGARDCADRQPSPSPLPEVARSRWSRLRSGGAHRRRRRPRGRPLAPTAIGPGPRPTGGKSAADPIAPASSASSCARW